MLQYVRVGLVTGAAVATAVGYLVARHTYSPGTSFPSERV